jgi:hypothetical protein
MRRHAAPHLLLLPADPLVGVLCGVPVGKALRKGLGEAVDLASSIHMHVDIEHLIGLHPEHMAMVGVVIGTDAIGASTTGIIEYRYSYVDHLKNTRVFSVLLFKTYNGYGSWPKSLFLF